MKKSKVALFIFLFSSIILKFYTTVGLDIQLGLKVPVGYDNGYFLTGASRHLLHKTSRVVSDPTSEVIELFQEGCLWSESLEILERPMFDEEHTGIWRERAQVQQIIHLESGCGRVTNGLATFTDGSKACVRYGIDADQVQGEILAYHLARMLGIYNLPPTVLSKPDPEKKQWMLVRESIESLHWTTEAIVSLTEWVPNLTGVFIPTALRKGGEGLNPTNVCFNALRNKTTTFLIEMMQWTDLILFDYLIANFDRLASHLFNLQWDARMMERTTSNLLKSKRGLVFIDNEAGLVHGYRVLNSWEKYHKRLLRTVCIFRKRTVQRIAELKLQRNVSSRLLELYKADEPLALELGFLSEQHLETLQNRVDLLYEHVEQCKLRHTEPVSHFAVNDSHV
ncbi:four-jointed box protein 1 [Alosa alosa]|uniref:four-jointed box protein 1 n=1 Tax=Alosa alosa TaxID=278164 RepID=UPI002015422A|nr:four-jointed box protein 1 [Alosa alosa]